MKTVQNKEHITLKVDRKELLQNKWLAVVVLSKKLASLEEAQSMVYKKLRNKMYNSLYCNKYNVRTIAGLKCVDVKRPMKADASLMLSFEVE